MSFIGARPRSIHDASLRISDGAEYAPTIKELLDEIAMASPVVGSRGDRRIAIPYRFIELEPLPLRDAVEMAHIAGLAEYLSQLAVIKPPEWVEKPEYFLAHATYICGPRAMPAFLAETPAPFRRRHLFCGPAAETLVRLLG